MIKLIAEIVSLLSDSGFCEDIQILETSQFSSQQYAFKIRSTIFSAYFLQIRIYYNLRHHLDEKTGHLTHKKTGKSKIIGQAKRQDFKKKSKKSANRI